MKINSFTNAFPSKDNFSEQGLTKLEWATIHMMGVLVTKTTTSIGSIVNDESCIFDSIAQDAAYLAQRALCAAEEATAYPTSPYIPGIEDKANDYSNAENTAQ